MVVTNTAFVLEKFLINVFPLINFFISSKCNIMKSKTQILSIILTFNTLVLKY